MTKIHTRLPSLPLSLRIAGSITLNNVQYRLVNRDIQMKIKSFLAKPFASYIYKGIRKAMATAVV